MSWLALDLSICLGGFGLLAFGRWIMDLTQKRVRSIPPISVISTQDKSQ